MSGANQTTMLGSRHIMENLPKSSTCCMLKMGEWFWNLRQPHKNNVPCHINLDLFSNQENKMKFRYQKWCFFSNVYTSFHTFCVMLDIHVSFSGGVSFFRSFFRCLHWFVYPTCSSFQPTQLMEHTNQFHVHFYFLPLRPKLHIPSYPLIPSNKNPKPPTKPGHYMSLHPWRGYQPNQSGLATPRFFVATLILDKISALWSYSNSDLDTQSGRQTSVLLQLAKTLEVKPFTFSF